MGKEQPWDVYTLDWRCSRRFYCFLDFFWLGHAPYPELLWDFFSLLVRATTCLWWCISYLKFLCILGEQALHHWAWPLSFIQVTQCCKTPILCRHYGDKVARIGDQQISYLKRFLSESVLLKIRGLYQHREMQLETLLTGIHKQRENWGQGHSQMK